MGHPDWIARDWADYGRIAEKLGWRPRTSLRTALTRTLAYYRKEFRHYV